MADYKDPRIGKEIRGLVTGNEYQVQYRGSRIQGTLEGLEGDRLVLRACLRTKGYARDLVDRVEIPLRYSIRFERL
jgi:hypothetical protein